MQRCTIKIGKILKMLIGHRYPIENNKIKDSFNILKYPIYIKDLNYIMDGKAINKDTGLIDNIYELRYAGGKGIKYRKSYEYYYYSFDTVKDSDIDINQINLSEYKIIDIEERQKYL